MPNALPETHLQASPRDSRDLRIELLTGLLEISVTRGELALEDLCDFAARSNPKRGFLFVSKVLGRHLPTRPSLMRDVQRRLARKIPADLPGPVVLLGLAETAICLGQGVHSRYLDLTGRDDVLFIHTTRHRLEHARAFEFLEEHSHAARHFVYRPEAARDRAVLERARSVVLVDDEVSTGQTLVNLAQAYFQLNPRLERALCLTITDWRGPRRIEAASRSMPVASSWRSLLEGEHRFTPTVVPPGEAKAWGEPAAGIGVRLERNFGRLGLRTPPALPSEIVERLGIRRQERVLVLGTGELCYLPFRLAEALEEKGCEVYCQATTRSPALMGHAIRRMESFPDSCSGPSRSFLYNVEPRAYDRILLCSETSAADLPPGLLETLRATPLVF